MDLIHMRNEYGMHPQLRAMVVGRNGEVIRKIGTAARTELETFLDQRVHLFLNVKVARRQ